LACGITPQKPEMTQDLPHRVTGTEASIPATGWLNELCKGNHQPKTEWRDVNHERSNMTWLKDANGNKCSVEYFGTKKKAQAALDSLKNCEKCIDCSYCSYCSDCWELKEEKKQKQYKIPAIENIHELIYEATSHPESLEMSTWHTCEKTHCRAGWTVTLAGQEGKELEKFFNTELAAMLIYRESGYKINPARFYDSNDDALADMKRLAEMKSAGR
jgi:hypothetical protein